MMENLLVITIIVLISGLISFFWVRGIDHMNKNHPDYKGEDFLNWDDNKIHTEDDF